MFGCDECLFVCGFVLVYDVYVDVFLFGCEIFFFQQFEDVFDVYCLVVCGGWFVVELFDQWIVVVVGCDCVLCVKFVGYLFEYGQVVVIEFVYEMWVDFEWNVVCEQQVLQFFEVCV